MYELKVIVKDVDDLLALHRAMDDVQTCDFDVTSGSVVVDGKSLLGVLGFSKKRFTIKINGEEKDYLTFKEKISSYIEN